MSKIFQRYISQVRVSSVISTRIICVFAARYVHDSKKFLETRYNSGHYNNSALLKEAA
ncbi:MAG: hypothetical protein IJS99_04260 [Synergistaceae bacterium]|nr:hypothetical protein [Synergistaceae bacterium]